MYKWKVLGYSRGAFLHKELAIGDSEFVDRNVCIDQGLKELANVPVSFLLYEKVLVVEQNPQPIPWVMSSPLLWKYEERLKSFTTWPRFLYPRPEALARAGFFYTGVSDKVTCFWCGKTVHDWEPNDMPVEEHKRWSSTCAFLTMMCHPGGIDILPEKARPIGTGRWDNLPPARNPWKPV